MAVRCQAMKKMRRGNRKADASGTCVALSFILASLAGFLLPFRNKNRPFLAALGGVRDGGGRTPEALVGLMHFLQLYVRRRFTAELSESAGNSNKVSLFLQGAADRMKKNREINPGRKVLKRRLVAPPPSLSLALPPCPCLALSNAAPPPALSADLLQRCSLSNSY